MLELNIPEQELYNETTNTFFNIKPVKLKLEHSLISISKWEEKYHVPFLHTDNKTKEQVVYYIKCMSLTPIDDLTIEYLPQSAVEEIVNYIKDKHTATWFNERPKEGQSRKPKEIVTSEIIYYWMIELGVPIEFQKWHLERLLTLIHVIELKRQKQQKMSPKDSAAQRRMLNASRRARSHSKG